MSRRPAVDASPRNPKGKKALHFAIGRPLYERLEAERRRKGRSMTMEVEARLEASFADDALSAPAELIERIERLVARLRAMLEET